MRKRRNAAARLTSEKSIQDWLQDVISNQQLLYVIDGQASLTDALKSSEAANWWPAFPIDYLSRLRSLQAASAVLAELHDLELVSTSAKSISRTKREALFVDLLYSIPESSRFLAIEIKKERATARETATELLAYEHEILNHVPFASANDVLMVVVAREFSPLLDHAIAGLITWGRKKILCLRVDEPSDSRRLSIHLPKAWEAIGQKTLPATGIQTAYLCPYPDPALSREQVYEICETAINLMAREAERSGASGFAMVVEDHFFPGITQSPYSIVGGAVNPYAFLPQAESEGLVAANASAVSRFLLSESKVEEMTMSWDWIAADNGAARRYLSQFGKPAWEGFSDWDSFRDVMRWRSGHVTADRHIRPIRMEFWGVLGDYVRDVVNNGERMRQFLPGFCKPGIDWRHPHLGVMLLDEISVPPVIQGGQWTFAGIFALGIRLGRFASIAATYADAGEDSKRNLRAGLFWAEADLQILANEIGFRYLSAKEIEQAPPVIPIGVYENAVDVMKRLSEFASWFAKHFIGSSWPLLRQAFEAGLETFTLFDGQFAGDGEVLTETGRQAAEIARGWLSMTVSEVYRGQMRPWDREVLDSLLSDSFGDRIPLTGTEKKAQLAVAALDEAILIDKLFQDIPAIVSTWHPQLAHTLAPISRANRDWDFYKEQIRASRARGVKHPCLFLTAGGQLGVGSIPDGHPVPKIDDPGRQVLLVDNQTFAEIIYVISWADLASGSIPNFEP